MRKTIINCGATRLALVCLLVGLLPWLNSCKKESTDVTDLVSKVPSSAGAVVGINLGSLLEKAGCKVDGADITPGADLEKWIEGQTEYVANQKEALRLFLSGESGIDPAGAIFFVDAYGSYITAMLADTSRFMEFVGKQTGKEFTETDGIKTCGNVAIAGAQMWMCVSEDSTIDAKAIKNYSTLEREQSFSTNGFAAKIANMTNDVVGWGQIKTLTRRGMSFSDVATLNVVSGMLFEDASALSFSVDFLKGKMEGVATILNDKGEAAKYLLPADKIDVAHVKELATDADVIGAVCITKEFLKKVEKVSSSLGGNMLGPVIKMLGSIDGTVAVAMSNVDNPSEGISGVVTTDGNPSLDLMSLLSQVAPTQKDGKLVRIKNGTVAGGLNVAKASEYLKGSTFGVVVNAAGNSLDVKNNGIKTYAISLNPDKSGVSLHLTMEGKNEGENMLMTLLKAGK